MLSTIWTWIKWIGIAIITIGAAILGIKYAANKKDTPVEPAEINPAEDRIKEDQAEIARKDKEIKQAEADAQKLADEAKKKAEANQASTTPGSVGDAVDNLNNALK